jgi:hypothetical protein
MMWIRSNDRYRTSDCTVSFGQQWRRPDAIARAANRAAVIGIGFENTFDIGVQWSIVRL